MLEHAKAAGAQVFVTSDYKYHEFFDADGHTAEWQSDVRGLCRCDRGLTILETDRVEIARIDRVEGGL